MTLIIKDAGLEASAFPITVMNAVLKSIADRAPNQVKASTIHSDLQTSLTYSTETKNRIAEAFYPERGKHIQQMRRDGRKWTFGMALGREIDRSLKNLQMVDKIKYVTGKGAGWVLAR